jgi:hypothetical protein
VIPLPGARRFRKLTLFENEEMVFATSEVEPTLIAVEMHAGALIESVYPLFPDAMTVAIFADRKLSTASLIEDLSASQFAKN